MTVVSKCWSKMGGTFMEFRLRESRGIRYEQHRDMANVLRAVLPAAVEMVAAARPEWAHADSPLANAAANYALCLGARENGLDVLGEGFASTLEEPEDAAAFAAFSSALSLNLLLYILVVPHLADSVGELHPDIAARTLAGLARGASWDTRGPWWSRWIAKRRRRRELRALLEAGSLPDTEWVRRFVNRVFPKTIWEMTQALIDEGIVRDAGKDLDDAPAEDA